MMFCSKCGHELEPGSLFCRMCGTEPPKPLDENAPSVIDGNTLDTECNNGIAQNVSITLPRTKWLFVYVHFLLPVLSLYLIIQSAVLLLNSILSGELTFGAFVTTVLALSYAAFANHVRKEMRGLTEEGFRRNVALVILTSLAFGAVIGYGFGSVLENMIWILAGIVVSMLAYVLPSLIYFHKRTKALSAFYNDDSIKGEIFGDNRILVWYSWFGIAYLLLRTVFMFLFQSMLFSIYGPTQSYILIRVFLAQYEILTLVMLAALLLGFHGVLKRITLSKVMSIVAILMVAVYYMSVQYNFFISIGMMPYPPFSFGDVKMMLRDAVEFFAYPFFGNLFWIPFILSILVVFRKTRAIFVICILSLAAEVTFSYAIPSVWGFFLSAAIKIALFVALFLNRKLYTVDTKTLST